MEAALKEAANAEAEVAAKEGKKKEQARAAAADLEARRKRVHPLTGREVRKGGAEHHFPEGHAVGGVNNWIGAKPKMSKELYEQRLARAGPDGLIHNADGTTEFIDGGKVSGANLGYNLAQGE